MKVSRELILPNKAGGQCTLIQHCGQNHSGQKDLREMSFSCEEEIHNMKSYIAQRELTEL